VKSMNGVVDTHAHLEEIANLDQALSDAKAAKVVGIIAVGSGLESNQKVLDIALAHPGFVFPAFGLHPWNIKETELERELEFLDAHANEALAIGEVGLDYHKKVIAGASKDLQKRVLTDVLKIGRKHDKPAALHSRYAWRDTLSLVEEAGIEKAVFHWYTGPSSVLRDIVARGYYLSVTPAVAYHEEHRRAARETPLDKLLLETDSPVVYGRGTESEFESGPVDVLTSLLGAALLKQITEDDIAAITTENAVTLFGLHLSSGTRS